MLTAGGWLQSLVDWCLLPLRGGFVELDLQIEKFRSLKQEYIRENNA